MNRLVWLVVLLPAIAMAEELPTYPGAVHTRIGEDLVIAGEHHQLAYFITRDPLRQVADYFFQQWRRQGYPTMVDGDGLAETVVSAFCTRKGLQRAVVLRRQGERTLGFVVLKELWTRAEPPAPLPGLEGTLLSQDVVASEEGGGTQRAVLVEADLAQARARVQAALERQGFRRAPGSSGRGPDGSATMEFVHGEERLLVAFSEPLPGLVVVLQTGSGPPSPGGGGAR